MDHKRISHVKIPMTNIVFSWGRYIEMYVVVIIVYAYNF